MTDKGEYMKEFALGDTLKDRVTGFTGIAVAWTEYYLCDEIRVFVQPEIKADGSWMEGQWLEESRLIKAA